MSFRKPIQHLFDMNETRQRLMGRKNEIHQNYQLGGVSFKTY